MKTLQFALLCVLLSACKNIATKTDEATNGTSEEVAESKEWTADETVADFDITPISHATAVMNWSDQVLYIDPVGGAEAFSGQPAPDLILVTDIHGDHLNVETLEAVMIEETQLIVPEAVAEKLSASLQEQAQVLNNGETKTFSGFAITGVPMYNLREEAKDFHTKGRGNGYVIEQNGLRVYFSGDTEDIPEMRNLENIDKAFVCMNLPYTMPVSSAADAVLDFQPKQVYPYHYRGQGGLSDVDQFKQLVNQGNEAIEVVQLNWYPNR
ncbi:MBL fold metallo-hydrolase [Croceiramulus getboli]|nr:MBL fold metallo-hydrolase [Flavobacteriaceae bacterium YJPT1-3]